MLIRVLVRGSSCRAGSVLFWEVGAPVLGKMLVRLLIPRDYAHESWQDELRDLSCLHFLSSWLTS